MTMHPVTLRASDTTAGATTASLVSFLGEAKFVYQEFERIVNADPTFERLRDSGMNRADAIEWDIAFLCTLTGDLPRVTGLGWDYAEYLRTLDPPRFLCHYFAFHFAHLAGGRDIGREMAKMMDAYFEDNLCVEFPHPVRMAFYEVSEDDMIKAAEVRELIDDIAASFTEEQLRDAYREVPEAFGRTMTLAAVLSRP
jgi:hypothetical protein